ncbi:hypothetical protein H6F70_05655 [Coleofasciculus sp. FACHB-T130]|nr:hypothetical protein [Coleofasciculus sp. FACHB-T130]
MGATLAPSFMKSNPVSPDTAKNGKAPAPSPQQQNPAVAELAAMREEMAALRAEVIQFRTGLVKQIKNGVLQAFLTIFLLVVALQVLIAVLTRF